METFEQHARKLFCAGEKKRRYFYPCNGAMDAMDERGTW